MTLANENFINKYTGDDIVDTFAYQFRILDETHIRAIVVDRPTQVLGTDFTVTDVGEANGGNVVFTVPPEDTKGITLVRDVPLTQLTDYTANSAFDSEANERALDKGVMISQQQQEEINRAIRLDITDTSGASLVLPAPEANKAWAWNTAADAIENVDIGGATNTDELPEGSTNLYYTEGRVSANASVVANTAKISYTDAAAVALNTAKVSADGVVSTHSDVDTTGAVSGVSFLGFVAGEWVAATPPGAGGGEVNDGVQLGTGADIFKQKVGLDLEFRSVIGGEGLTQVENTLDVTLDLDVNSLATEANSDSGDFYVFYDTTAGTHKKIDHDNMPGSGGSGVGIVELDTLVIADLLLSGAGTQATIYTVPGGKKAIVTSVSIECTEATSVTAFPEMRIGVGAAAEDIMPAQPVTIDALDDVFLFQPPIGVVHMANAGETVDLQVDSPISGTSAAALVRIYGREI